MKQDLTDHMCANVTQFFLLSHNTLKKDSKKMSFFVRCLYVFFFKLVKLFTAFTIFQGLSNRFFFQ